MPITFVLISYKHQLHRKDFHNVKGTHMSHLFTGYGHKLSGKFTFK